MIWRHLVLALPGVESVPTQVLDRAGRVARGLQAEVELFHSLYEPDLVQPREGAAPVEERIRARVREEHRHLESLADELREQGRLTVRASVHWDYPVYEGIIREVLRHHADLLLVPGVPMMGQSAHRTLTFREARLIEACPCPLLLLRTPQPESQGCVVAAVDPLHAFRPPQELDETLIEAARTIAHALGNAPVHLYHAVAPGHSAEERAGSRSRLANAQSLLRDLALRHDIPEERVHVVLGDVTTSLPGFARESRADVVVMGAQSRTYPGRALFGHTAERVLDELRCDVLVIKPRTFECPVSSEPAPAVPQPGCVTPG